MNVFWSLPRGGDEPERGRASAMVPALLPSPFASLPFSWREVVTLHESLRFVSQAGEDASWQAVRLAVH